MLHVVLPPVALVLLATLAHWRWGVDTRGTRPGMSSDAPAPVYDSVGNVVPAWHVRLEFDDRHDRLVVSWYQAEGGYTASRFRTDVYPVSDLEDAIAAVQRRARILGARRLL